MLDLFGDSVQVKEVKRKVKVLNKTTYKPKTPYEVKMEIVKGDKVLTAGAYSVTRFTPIQSYRKKTEFQKSAPWERFIMDVLDLGFDFLSDYKKPQDRYWIYTQELGCTPKTFVRMWNACCCKVFIDQDMKDVAIKYCKGRMGWYDKTKLRHLETNKEVIQQLLKDNMENIIPFALLNPLKDDFTVKGFRKVVGKSTWKTILKQSTHRNRLMSQILEDHKYYQRKDATWLIVLVNYPTSLLPTARDQHLVDEGLIPLIKKGRFMTKKDKVQNLHNIYKDTLRMERQLPEVRRPRGHTKWGVEDLTEWHDSLIEKITAKDFSKDEITWVDSYNLDDVEGGEFSATLLKSAFDIKMEGETMKHCVGGYANRVVKADYLVISIKDKEGLRYSTLGLNFREGGFRFNQHYMACNQSVDCPEAKLYAVRILDSLNKQYKKLTEEK